MQCGTCARCGQTGKLGYICSSGGAETFNCGACIDRYADDSEPEMALEVKDDNAEDNDYASICERMNVPERLSAVPTESVQCHTMFINYGHGLQSQELFHCISDPENNYFFGHGAMGVWPAARLLTQYLLSRSLKDLKVVELGAGAGLPGIAAARHGADVVLTELPWILPLTGYNVQANIAEHMAQPHLATLRWGSADDAAALTAKHGCPDLVIGADVAYRDDEIQLLFTTIKQLCAREVILSVVKREDIATDFCKAVANFNWHPEVLGFENNICIFRLCPTAHNVGGA